MLPFHIIDRIIDKKSNNFTCASIIYEIIMMESFAESGNFKGGFVVSISNAHTTGS